MTMETRFPVEPELWTPDEVQRFLKLPSKNWLYQKISAGTLPFEYTKVGSYLRFPASGVLKYIERQMRQGVPA